MLSSLFWKPYSRLIIVGDGADWAIDEETKQLKRTAKSLGLKTHVVKKLYFPISQVIHYTSQFSLLHEGIYDGKSRLSVDYFHGHPERQESFKLCFEALKKHHPEIARVRVSHKEMETLIKSSGIEPSKVMRIPIGVDMDAFTPQSAKKKARARIELDIPEDAVVIGSFQKDGVGWGEGLEPKLIKGPDLFLRTIEKLKKEIPNLWVLLSGPARGYVMKGLEAMDVPYRHRYPKEYPEVAKLYDALDLYIIASREEGGPKAMLEAMAKGVPLVTTAVGQCQDLVKHRENAMMTPIDNVEALYKSAVETLTNGTLRMSLINKGLFTAAENSFEAQLPLWKNYFKGLIDS